MKSKSHIQLNSIFNPLGYNVFPLNMFVDDLGGYGLFVKDSNKGLEYFGTFYLEYSTTQILFATYIDDTLYTFDKPEDLIASIKAFNDTRVAPAYCYCPISNKSWNFEQAFYWYTGLIGYTDPAWNDEFASYAGNMYYTKVYKNMYGENISKLTLCISTNSGKGSIIRSIGDGWTFLTSDFTTIDELIAAINSIVGPELLINASNCIKTVESLTDNVKDVELVKIDGNLNVYTNNAKNAIRLALQNALNNL